MKQTEGNLHIPVVRSTSQTLNNDYDPEKHLCVYRTKRPQDWENSQNTSSIYLRAAHSYVRNSLSKLNSSFKDK